MKKIVSLMICICMILMLTSCGDDLVYKGKTYETYGIFNKDEVRDENMRYKLIIGNAVWGIILVESIIGPVYFYGFSLYEPVGPKYIENQN